MANRNPIARACGLVNKPQVIRNKKKKSRSEIKAIDKRDFSC